MIMSDCHKQALDFLSLKPTRRRENTRSSAPRYLRSAVLCRRAERRALWVCVNIKLLQGTRASRLCFHTHRARRIYTRFSRSRTKNKLTPDVCARADPRHYLGTGALVVGGGGMLTGTRQVRHLTQGCSTRRLCNLEAQYNSFNWALRSLSGAQQSQRPNFIPKRAPSLFLD